MDRESMDFVTGPIEVVGCHAAGEIGDVIVSGVAPPPGETVWEQSRWIASDQRLRRHLLNEPRGGDFKHVNLLVPATDPNADIGFIIMEPSTRLDPRRVIAPSNSANLSDRRPRTRRSRSPSALWAAR